MGRELKIAIFRKKSKRPERKGKEKGGEKDVCNRREREINIRN